MGLLRTSLLTPDYGHNGVVTASTVATGTNTALDVLSAADAKDWMKVDSSSENTLISELISETIDNVEQQYSFQIIEKTVTANWESFGQRVDLPLFPVKAVSSVKTINNEGTETVLASGSDFYLAGDTLVIKSVHGYDLPYQRLRLQVTYVAGFDTIPGGIITGLKKAVLSAYEDRQDLVEGSVSELPTSSKTYFKKYAKLI